MWDFMLYLMLLGMALADDSVECDCRTLEFIKELLQDEIFERKLEHRNLLSEVEELQAFVSGRSLASKKTLTAITAESAFEKRLAALETYADHAERVDRELHDVTNRLEAFETRPVDMEAYDEDQRIDRGRHTVNKSMEAFDKRLAVIETRIDNAERVYHERGDVSSRLDAFEKRIANIETYVDGEKHTDRERHELSRRLDAFEKRFTSIETYVEDAQRVDNHRHEINRETEKTRSFNVFLKKALNMEKLERVNFMSVVQRQVDDLNDTMYQFRTTTDNFVGEQISNIYAQFELFDKNMSVKFDEFGDKTSVNLRNEVDQIKSDFASLRIGTEHYEHNMNDRLIHIGNELIDGLRKQQLHTTLVIDTIVYNTTTVMNTGLEECKADIDLIEVNMLHQRAIGDKNTNELTELRMQYADHISKVDARISTIHHRLIGCQQDWIKIRDRCYYYSKISEKCGWVEASRRCKESNGTLVKIDSEYVNDELAEGVRERNDAFWIGLNDRYREDVWVWLDIRSMRSAPLYTNWNTKEPNNDNSGEDCAVIMENGKWNDGPCGMRQRYICASFTLFYPE